MNIRDVCLRRRHGKHFGANLGQDEHVASCLPCGAFFYTHPPTYCLPFHPSPFLFCPPTLPTTPSPPQRFSKHFHASSRDLYAPLPIPLSPIGQAWDRQSVPQPCMHCALPNLYFSQDRFSGVSEKHMRRPVPVVLPALWHTTPCLWPSFCTHIPFTLCCVTAGHTAPCLLSSLQCVASLSQPTSSCPVWAGKTPPKSIYSLLFSPVTAAWKTCLPHFGQGLDDLIFSLCLQASFPCGHHLHAHTPLAPPSLLLEHLYAFSNSAFCPCLPPASCSTTYCLHVLPPLFTPHPFHYLLLSCLIHILPGSLLCTLLPPTCRRYHSSGFLRQDIVPCMHDNTYIFRTCFVHASLIIWVPAFGMKTCVSDRDSQTGLNMGQTDGRLDMAGHGHGTGWDGFGKDVSSFILYLHMLLPGIHC